MPSQPSSLCHSTPQAWVGGRCHLLGMVVEQGSPGSRRQTGKVPRVTLPGDEAPKPQSVSGASSKMGLAVCRSATPSALGLPPLTPQSMGAHLASVQGKKGGLGDRGNSYLVPVACPSSCHSCSITGHSCSGLTHTEVLGLGSGAEKPGSHFCLPVTSSTAYCRPSCFPFLCHSNLLFKQQGTCLIDWSSERKNTMGGEGQGGWS